MIWSMPSRVGTPLPLTVLTYAAYVPSAASRSTLRKLETSATVFSFDLIISCLAICKARMTFFQFVGTAAHRCDHHRQTAERHPGIGAGVEHFAKPLFLGVKIIGRA